MTTSIDKLIATIDEATPFLAVLVRVHEVFDNLQPGQPGRLAGAWRLYEAGWRADKDVEEAHRLLSLYRRTPEQLDAWRAWAATVAGVDPVTTSDADLRMYVWERIKTLQGLVEEYRKVIGR